MAVNNDRYRIAGWLVLGMVALAAYVAFADQGAVRRINAWIVADAAAPAPVETTQGRPIV